MSIPAVATKCDLAIDANTALLFSEDAILAAGTAACDDKRAVWAHIPSAFPQREALIYLHGHNGYVKVDASGKSKVPDWVLTHRRGEAGGTLASGIKYKIGSLSTTKHQPLALVPEEGIPVTKYINPAGNEVTASEAALKEIRDEIKRVKELNAPIIEENKATTEENNRRKKAVPPLPPLPLRPLTHSPQDPFWSYEDSGNLTKPGGLGNLIANCFEHLCVLAKPTAAGGGTYFDPKTTVDTATQAFDPTTLKRLFLSGHSGGGRSLAAATISKLALEVPTCLWMLDCTYGGGLKECRQFCENWSGKNHLGMTDTDSRMVIITKLNNASGTENNTKAIVNDLKSSTRIENKVSVAQKAFSVKEITHHHTGSASAAETTAMLKALETEPLLVIHTSVEHDDIPTFFLPLFLEHNHKP